MIRWIPSLLTVLLVPLVAGQAIAQVSPPERLPVSNQQRRMYRPVAGSRAGLPPIQPGYPYLNAPLYPSPQPNIPVQVGSTMLTNQAFYPQEMLYEHDYMALYPPYYYRVKGWWVNMPFVPSVHERWELLGTKVTVKYRSSVPIWSGFTTPHRDFFDWDNTWDDR